MRHDCEATEERLVDLLFGEVEDERRGALLEEVVRCESCARRYRRMTETLRVFDEAAEAVLPGETFWNGYEERLRTRMAQEIRTDFWRQAAFPFARGEYHLTFVEDDGLARRLARQLKSVAEDAGLTWPEFKRDPVGFTRRSFGAYGQAGLTFFSQRNVALATFSSFLFITLLLGSVFALERLRGNQLAGANPYENLQVVGMINPDDPIPEEQKQPEKGTAGTETGKGGGSKPKQDAAHGGGGGGRDEQLQASTGKLPAAQLAPPILTANPNPPAVANPHLPTPVTINVDPMLIKPDARDIAYGDPKSTATTPSSGSGHGGGMGDGNGGGVGSGDGSGYGPGRGGNIGGGDYHEGGGGRGGEGGGGPVDYNRIFTPKDVTQRALITSKPEPSFTEAARKDNVTGLVRLRAVLSASGAVTGITVVKGLSDGLTEKAIEAAKQIKFRPAQKDGHAVSQYVTLEY